jgi:hypothetical protein
LDRNDLGAAVREFRGIAEAPSGDGPLELHNVIIADKQDEVERITGLPSDPLSLSINQIATICKDIYARHEKIWGETKLTDDVEVAVKAMRRAEILERSLAGHAKLGRIVAKAARMLDIAVGIALIREDARAWIATRPTEAIVCKDRADADRLLQQVKEIFGISQTKPCAS